MSINNINKILEDAKTDKALYKEAENIWNELKEQFLNKLNFEIKLFEYNYGFIFNQIAEHTYIVNGIRLQFIPKDFLKAGAKYTAHIVNGKVAQEEIRLGYSTSLHSESIMDEEDFLGLLDMEFKSSFIHEYTHKNEYKRAKSVSGMAKSAANLADKGEYNNTPMEFNAHYMQLYNEIQQLQEIQRGKFTGNTFDEFIKHVRMNTFTLNYLLRELNPNYRRKLKKRLFQLYKSEFEPEKFD